MSETLRNPVQYERECEKKKCCRCDNDAYREVFGWIPTEPVGTPNDWHPVCDDHNFYGPRRQVTDEQ